MSSVSDIVADGVSTTSVDVYSVSSVSDITADGVSTTSVDVYYVSSVLDVGVDSVSYAYVDVVEAAQQAKPKISTTLLAVLALMALFIFDLFASRKKKRR